MASANPRIEKSCCSDGFSGFLCLMLSLSHPLCVLLVTSSVQGPPSVVKSQNVLTSDCPWGLIVKMPSVEGKHTTPNIFNFTKGSNGRTNDRNIEWTTQLTKDLTNKLTNERANEGRNEQANKQTKEETNYRDKKVMCHFGKSKQIMTSRAINFCMQSPDAIHFDNLNKIYLKLG